MQQWEYCFVGCQTLKGGRDQITINGIPQVEELDFWEMLVDLGDDGWELVNAETHASGRGFASYFKRPKSNKSENHKTYVRGPAANKKKQ